MGNAQREPVEESMVPADQAARAHAARGPHGTSSDEKANGVKLPALQFNRGQIKVESKRVCDWKIWKDIRRAKVPFEEYEE
jgi:hypothetical protein